MIDPGAHWAAVFVIPTTRAARHERTQDGQADNSADCDEEPEEQRSLRGGGPLVIRQRLCEWMICAPPRASLRSARFNGADTPSVENHGERG